jgi:dTDP-4-dehydrorhamnose reductase
VPGIVVIGESGQLAQSLARLRWPAGCALDFAGRRRLPADFGPAGINAMLQALKPDLVLNAAAYTAVDRAESEPEAATALNAALPRALAAACGALDIPLVHVSTDYVFDGEKRSPYLETDTPNPLSVYGATKLAGDRAIEGAALRRWAILRSSWVVSEFGETFPVKLLRRACAGEPLRVVDDQWGCPTAASDLARAIQSVGLRLLDGDPAAAGLFNFRGASEMSWYGFADKLLSAAERSGLRLPPLRAVKSADLNASAQRPAYSVLACERIAHRLGIQCRDLDTEHMMRLVLGAHES